LVFIFNHTSNLNISSIKALKVDVVLVIIGNIVLCWPVVLWLRGTD
jgi:hypothetical protein